MLTFQSSRVLELKMTPMDLADARVLRYAMLVELTAEEYARIVEGLKAGE